MHGDNWRLAAARDRRVAGQRERSPTTAASLKGRNAACGRLRRHERIITFPRLTRTSVEPGGQDPCSARYPPRPVPPIFRAERDLAGTPFKNRPADAAKTQHKIQGKSAPPPLLRPALLIALQKYPLPDLCSAIYLLCGRQSGIIPPEATRNADPSEARRAEEKTDAQEFRRHPEARQRQHGRRHEAVRHRVEGLAGDRDRIRRLFKKSFEDGSAALEKLFGAKSLEKAIEIQSDYAKSAYEGFVAEATKMGELYTISPRKPTSRSRPMIAKVTPAK